MRRFAISDIHGCLASFKNLVQYRIDLQPEDELYLLGDYIDRGEDSKGVIDFIEQLRQAGYKVHCLRGNHEDMMLSAYAGDKNAFESWYRNGGRETIASFGVESLWDIPESYFKFLLSCQLYFDLPDYLLVHAGFDFRAQTFEELVNDVHAMLWIRHWHSQYKPELVNNRRIVHGHTPMPHLLQQEQPPDSVIFNIDGGCVYTSQDNLGYLCALDLDSRKLLFQQNIDDIIL